MSLNTSIFDQFPELKTKRLTLRNIELEDAHEIFKMRASQRVNQFIARHNMSDEKDAHDLVVKTQNAFKNKTGIGWSGMLRDQSQTIGTCGFNRIDYDNLRAEIGGEMSVDYWGKKLALEAVEAIIDFGFNTFNLHAIEAYLFPENRGALYLLQNLGFEKEAHFKDKIFFDNQFHDMVVYTRIK